MQTNMKWMVVGMTLSSLGLGLAGAQAAVTDDPAYADAMKMMQNAQDQKQNIPAEIVALMPSPFKAQDQSFFVEPNMKSLLNVSLGSGVTTVKDYQTELKIVMNAYDMSSEMGKMMGGSSLPAQRKEAVANWTSAHPATQQNETHYGTPEKIALPKGYLLIQKVHTPRHEDGEGMVNASTTFNGFLYMDVDGGYLTAQADAVKDSKADLEAWLRSIAEKAGKLKIRTYFK